MVKRILNIALAISIVSSLTACESHYSGARKDPATILARVEKDIVKTAIAREDKDSYIERSRERATRPNSIVKIPRNAKWLRANIEARYEGVPAREAIAVVLESRPHRFDISELGVSTEGRLESPSGFSPTDSQQVTLATGEKVFVPVPSKADKTPLPMDVPVASVAGLSTIKQHLDAICSQSGLSYAIESGVVVFSNFMVEVVPIRAASMNGDQRYLFSNNQAQEQLASGALNLTIYDEVVSTLSKIVRQPNSFSINKSANVVTLQATKDVMRQAKLYLASINYASGRRVALRLDIYDVNLSALGKRSFDFSISNLISNYSALEGVSTDIVLNGQQQVNAASATTAISFGVDKPGGTLNGASGLIRILRSKGAITGRIAKEYIVSNNEQIDEIRTRNTPYVSRVSIQEQFQGATSSNTPNIDTKDANTGTAIQIYPTISGNNVYVNMTVEESRLIRFDEYSFGGQDGVGLIAGRLPVTDKSQSRFKFGMQDGETLAIAGSITSQREHEVANAGIPILNDSVDKNEIRTQTLIFVSANILD